MTKSIWILLVAIAGLIAAFSLGQITAGSPGQDGEQHDEHSHKSLESSEDLGAVWTCPMHPQIRSDKPGTCPICHMDLVEAAGAGQGPGDDVVVRLSEGARRLARVQNGEVEAGALTGELDLFGTVEINENAEVDLTAWTGGRIEALMVSAVGEEVRRGQLLARVYSPEILAAQRSLIQAKRAMESAEEAGSERREKAARASYQAARTELRLLGVDERQVDAIEASDGAKETVDIYATASGTVREKWVSEGDYLEKGQRVLSLAALDSIWVQLEIYERDLGRLDVGAPVQVRIPALGGQEREGRISFISPEIDRERRVALARVVLPNEDGRLRPGLYVDAQVQVVVGDEETLSVARSAVMWTGKRSLVYVYDTALEPPGYVPRRVSVGPRVGDRVVVEEGLVAGEEVAIRGAFRLDASLQIQGGPTMMSALHESGPGLELTAVELDGEGREFDPPIDPSRLPEGAWYCDMGKTHWAQPEQGDDECPVCGMRLTQHAAHDHEDSQRGGDHGH